MDAIDYISDSLDIELRTSLSGEYRSARVLIAFGGPNAWIDTYSRQLEVYWDERVFFDLPKDFCDAIDEALENIRYC